RRRRGSTGSSCAWKPTGIAASMRARTGPRSSGRSSAVSDVRTPIMPHPMSTPTALGDTASRIAMTEPTVAPLPRWTSGMTRTPSTHGSAAMLRSCCSAAGSTAGSCAHMRVGAFAPDSGTGNAWASVLTVLTSSGRPDDHDAAPEVRRGCAREESNLRRPAAGTGAPAVERRALVLLNVEQTGREASSASGGSRTPVSASVERRRVRRTAKAVLFAVGARQIRTDGGEKGKAAREMHPGPGAFPHKKKAAPAVSGTACRTTLWSDDRAAGVAGEERGHAEIRHGQHDVPLLAGQRRTSPVLLDGFAHGTAPLA